MMSRGFRAVSGRREGKVYETRFAEAQGIQGPEGLVGIAAPSARTEPKPSIKLRSKSDLPPFHLESSTTLVGWGFRQFHPFPDIWLPFVIFHGQVSRWDAKAGRPQGHGRSVRSASGLMGWSKSTE